MEVLLFCFSLFSRRRSSHLLRPLTFDELPQKGDLCGIDAEFVALKEEEAEVRSDGTRALLRPSRFSLARLSVVRGQGPDEGVPFMDEYIATTEPIFDYLTDFSGIRPGDLDPNISTHRLIPLKAAYRKLRILLDIGCLFVGHGLKKDFRTISKFTDLVFAAISCNL